MKNIPKEIYLQIGEDCDGDDFNELAEVSWCQDKINNNDIRYVHWTEELSALRSKVKPECPGCGNRIAECSLCGYDVFNPPKEDIKWFLLSNLMKLNPRILEYPERNRENLRVVRYFSPEEVEGVTLSNRPENPVIILDKRYRVEF